MEPVFPTACKTVCGSGQGAVMGSTPIRPLPSGAVKGKGRR